MFHRLQVVARDEKWFITELLDKWKVDYERRKRHHHTGYFALNHVPYKTFANLKHTDVYDLLGHHLGILMNRQYAFMQVSLYQKQSLPITLLIVFINLMYCTIYSH